MSSSPSGAESAAPRNTFHVVKAFARANPRRNDRPDLDMPAQRRKIDQHLSEKLNEVLLSQWRSTCASRASHTAMLKLLVTEAVRFRREVYNDPLPPGSVAHIVSRTEQLMAGNDNYGALITEIAAMHLFQP